MDEEKKEGLKAESLSVVVKIGFSLLLALCLYCSTLFLFSGQFNNVTAMNPYFLLPTCFAVMISNKLFFKISEQKLANYIAGTLIVYSFIVFFIEPFSPFPHRTKSYESTAKSDLHHMYLGCKLYWQEKGDDKICDSNIASQEKYGYAQNKAVRITGKGTEKDFMATAQHQKSSMVFTIDSYGTINER